MNNNHTKIAINPKVLLSIYAVMPIFTAFIVIDTIFLNNKVQQVLPLDPRVYVWFVLLFMLPHILASFFSFADKEYFNHYKPRLLKGAQIAVLLGIFLPAIAGATMLPVLAFATYTMIHVFLQQSGVAKSLMRNSDPLHAYWQWIGIAISTVIYIYLLIPLNWLDVFLRDSRLLVIIITCLAIVIYSILAGIIVKKSRTKLGKKYFLASHVIPLFGILFIVTGYPIFALVVPRLIHDLTAYTYYITHDYNRFADSKSNFLYKLTSRIKLPVFIASPLVSILLAYLVSMFNTASIAVVLTCLFFLHYYTESVIWKKDTLHRVRITYKPYH